MLCKKCYSHVSTVVPAVTRRERVVAEQKSELDRPGLEMPSEPPQEPPPPPKLLLHKPSKAQLKAAKAKGGSFPTQAPPSGYSRSPASMDPPSSSPPSSAAPELNPKKPFLRRIFPLILVANFAVGAYVLLRTTNKESAEKDEEVPREKEVASAPVESAKSEVSQQPPIQPAEAKPKEVLPPIPQDEQRELFKWILEEKRKVKPASSSEKKKLDEEKALVKQYIRANSIPTL